MTSTRRRALLPTIMMLLAMTAAVFALITAGNKVGGGATDDNNVAPTAGISTVGASLLVSGLTIYTPATVPAVMADSPGGGGANTWSTTTARSSAVVQMQIVYAINPTVNASHTFSTVNGLLALPAIAVQAFVGTDTTSPFDDESGSTISGANAIATGTILPTANDDVLVACLALQVTDTPTIFEAGWSSVAGFASDNLHHFGSWCAYKIQTTATAEGATFQWTNSSYAASSIASFKVFSGGPPPSSTNCYRALLGVGCDAALHPRQWGPFTAPWLVGQSEHGQQQQRAADQRQPSQQLPFVVPVAGLADVSANGVDLQRRLMHSADIHKAADYSARLPMLSKGGHALP